MIRGGTGTAMVPDRCRVSIDRRLLPGQSGEQARAEIDALLASLDLPADDLAAGSRAADGDPELRAALPTIRSCSPRRAAAIDAGAPGAPASPAGRRRATAAT